MHSPAVVFTTLAIVVNSMFAAQKDSAELAAVLDRAAQYVTFYEDQQLGNVGATESDRQVSVSFSPNDHVASSFVELSMLTGDGRVRT